MIYYILEEYYDILREYYDILEEYYESDATLHNVVHPTGESDSSEQSAPDFLQRYSGTTLYLFGKITLFIAYFKAFRLKILYIHPNIPKFAAVFVNNDYDD